MRTNIEFLSYNASSLLKIKLLLCLAIDICFFVLELGCLLFNNISISYKNKTIDICVEVSCFIHHDSSSCCLPFFGVNSFFFFLKGKLRFSINQYRSKQNPQQQRDKLLSKFYYCAGRQQI